MRGNYKLLQALMIQIVCEINRVYRNVNQENWGESESDYDCCEWFVTVKPAVLGRVVITTEGDFDKWAIFSFNGIVVTTELGSKRLFHYSDPGALTDHALVAWFNEFMCELERVNDEWLTTNGVNVGRRSAR